METSALFRFQKMVDVNLPIIYIQNFDFARVDAFISQAIGGTKVEEWNPATGLTDFKSRNEKGNGSKATLANFLHEIYFREPAPGKNNVEGFVVLKEIQDYIDDPQIKTLLELIAQRKLYDREYDITMIIESSVRKVPEELKHYVSFLDYEFPTDSEIESLIKEHIETNGYEERGDKAELNELKLTLKGMSKYDIDRMLDMAMSTDGSLGKEDKGVILAQKKGMVRNSGLLDLIEVDYYENEDDALAAIGGMKKLKEYLREKSAIIKNAPKAIDYGVNMPKGIFLVGMPGCGKSLSAKAAASLFGVPLLKMDMGSLMGKYVGESESKLRQAIRIAEAAAPCVLWIDEIEKGFSGTAGGKDEVMTRMFGYFLSWMQDKKSTVYVIATANDANNLPPELKRKGRFDEIFCINLPKPEERKEIFKVHFNNVDKRRKKNGRDPLFASIKNSNLQALINKTDGFNGADIESVVNEVTEDSFNNSLQNKSIDISLARLEEKAANTVSISKSCKKQIDNMKRIFADSNFKDAS